MGDEGREVSLRLLLKFCFEQEAQERMESYLSPQELIELYPDMTALDQKVSEGIDALQKEEKRQMHRPLRVLKRTFLVAAVLISIFSCIMLTSATVRNAIVNTIIDWTGRDVGIQFVIEGEPLSALPDGYGPHYIPEGLEFLTADSVQDKSFLLYTYQSPDGLSILDIQIQLLENGSMTWIDNEHMEFEQITFNGMSTYLGHGFSVAGGEIYTMLWAKDGMEHSIYTNVSLSELFKIAENIY